MLSDTGHKIFRKLLAVHNRKEGADNRVPLTIGIPRMFYYYIYPCLWETFFSALGMQPVVSGLSTAKTVRTASQISETEHCLPSKLFDAHLAELAGRVDMIFVPRVLATIKDHLSCPKFGPLPDAARADIARATEVLSIDIDETARPLSGSLMLLGKKLNMPKDRTASAVKSALTAMEDARNKMSRPVRKKGRPHFLLAGHHYTIHDNFIAGPVLNKLQSMGADVELISFAENTPEKSYILWSTSNAIYHKLNTISADEYDGVIQLSVFNCGCDSMMMDTYRQLVRGKNIPYMYLMIDEHSAQAGVDTRVEAFIDSLGWQK